MIGGMREFAFNVATTPASSAASPPAFDARSLAAAVGGRLLRDSRRPIVGASVDSRLVQSGNAFFALPGERTDGHHHLPDAVEHGAAALIVSRSLSDAALDELAGRGDGPGPAVIVVADGLAALHAAADDWRSRFAPLVVGVTGSLAKTSTKEQIAEVLSERHVVLRNNANENNEIGLPLTLLRLAPEHEAAVLEMGMYVPGDIAQLAALARPSIGVVTAVRGTHLARAGSIEAIEQGKRELVEALPAGGTAVLNADDPRVLAMAGFLPAGVTSVSYGFSPSADVTATELTSRAEAGMSFVLRNGSGQVTVTSPALGRHGVHNALAAAAVGLAAGLDLQQIAAGLRRPVSAPHRSVLLDLGAWRILDDTYNAAPDSMVAALDLLATLSGRRVAVLGEMLELGAASRQAHVEVGVHAAGCVDLLVCIGRAAADYGRGAVDAGLPAASIARVDSLAAALGYLLDNLRGGDVVLLKGSRGAALDVLVAELEAAVLDDETGGASK
jgi:UDP-N-acetylmuramoyl-tripeptide--D-alanyl-D-alanine ligase